MRTERVNELKASMKSFGKENIRRQNSLMRCLHFSRKM